MLGSISALVDASTAAVLALSAHPSVVEYLAKGAGLDAEKVHGINWPNYRAPRSFPLLNCGPDVYPMWVWDGKTRQIKLGGTITPELRLRSVLATGKCKALTEVMHELSVARYSLCRGVLMQDTVYQRKLEEAQAPRRDGPFIVQYAKFAGLSIEHAADEILFKAKLDDAILLKTEGIRLEYFNLIRNAKKVEELEPILKQFREETYRGSSL